MIRVEMRKTREKKFLMKYDETSLCVYPLCVFLCIPIVFVFMFKFTGTQNYNILCTSERPDQVGKND